MRSSSSLVSIEAMASQRPAARLWIARCPLGSALGSLLWYSLVSAFAQGRGTGCGNRATEITPNLGIHKEQLFDLDPVSGFDTLTGAARSLFAVRHRQTIAVASFQAI